MNNNLGYMARYGSTLVDNGWPIIPIMPGAKVPGQYARGQWKPYAGWQRHCTRPTKPLEVNIWERWPDCAIGIACGAVIAIDIDITDAEQALKIETLARDRLGDTPLLRIGQAPKRLLIYRTDTSFPSIQRANIQILANGRQFLAYAIHPETKRPYEWLDSSPLDVDLTDVPAVDNASCQTFLNVAAEMLPIEMRASRLPIAPDHVASGKGKRGTYEAIADALAWLPNDDWHYDDWIAIGLAVKGALGEQGRDLWMQWSAKSTKHDPDYAARKWDHDMRNPRAGAGTIYWHASRYGWVPLPSLILDAEEAEHAALPHPAEALIERVAAHAKRAPDRRSPVSDLLHLDGLLKRMVDSIVMSAVSPQPLLALAASLTALGALMGRRYRSPTGLRSNLYTVGIANSGGGKEHARKWIKEAFFAAGLQMYLGGNNIASGQAILTSLRAHASRLYQLDEFGHFLASVLSHRAPTHKLEVWARLTELYTQADGWLQGTEYANQKERPREDICQPTCCVHATTAPAPFWKALEGGSMIDGSLARWLIFQSEEDYPEIVDDPMPIAVSDDLCEALRAITRGAIGHDYGGNTAMLMTAEAAPTPYTVPYAPGAQKAFRELKAQEREWLRQGRSSGHEAIIARYAENSIKVALIRAVSANPERPEIQLAHAEWAAKLVAHCIETTLTEAAAHLADNETEAKHKKVMQVIRQAGANGISQSCLTRNTQYLKSHERSDIVNALIEAGLVVADIVGTATKPARRYRATEILQELSTNPSREDSPLTH